MNPTSIRECLRISPRVFGIPNALSPDMIPVIARATKASMEEAGVQARDEEAAATQGPPHKKRLLDEGSLQEIEEDAAAPSASSLPRGEPAGVLLCLLSSHGGGGTLCSTIDSLFVHIEIKSLLVLTLSYMKRDL